MDCNLMSKDIKKRDWLLLFGLMLAPMTGLRIWKVGPAEVLCLVWALKYVHVTKIKKNIVIDFFVFFLTSMLIGTVIGYIVNAEEMGLEGFITWIYLGLFAVLLYEGLSKNSLDYNFKMLNIFSIMSVLWYSFLYFYSVIVSKSFLGAPLWYAEYRYTGGANNPHQLAVLMCGILYIFIGNIIKCNKIILNIFYAVMSLYILLQTVSSTGVASVVVALLLEIYLYTTKIGSNNRVRTGIIFFETMLVLVMFVGSFDYLYDYIYTWIASDPNGLGRFEIASYFPEVFSQSPIFGLGPGSHVNYGFWGLKEFHNTYLEILVETGIIGFMAFLVLTIKTFNRISVDYTFIPVLTSVYVYGLGGFAMRRLIYWGLFIFILVISEQITRQRMKK